MPPSIVLTGVSKRYVKYQDAPMLVSRVMSLRSRTRRSQLWALRDVNLQVEPGECLGVIGRNGSGKSTLLRLLAGVTAPTEGSVTVRGRVSPLIAVGVGFHPELTGRENVYVNGIVLGLSRAEINRRFDEILAFSEVSEFIDTPVKFYSSGMFVRLGFAVAVAADPRVLLVDEVLSVGDLAFQVKCQERMMDVRNSGTTVVVVSHNLNVIRRMCDRSIVLHGGVVRCDGDTDDAISVYHQLLGEVGDVDADLKTPGGIRIDVGARLQGLRIVGADAQPTAHIVGGEEVLAQVDVVFERDIVSPHVGFNVANESGIHVYAHSECVNGGNRTYRAGEHVTFEARAIMRLTTGSYSVGMSLAAGDTMLPVAVPPRRYRFFVANTSRARGVADLDARFGEAAGTES